jgi:ApaG protein
MSRGVRITVRPAFVTEKESNHTVEYLFSYMVRIENMSGANARLMSRRWLIHDSIGEEMVVEGEGVIGVQPLIPPGGVHEYASFCVLKSPEGYMEGEYFFERADGSTFSAAIPRFELQVQ